MINRVQIVGLVFLLFLFAGCGRKQEQINTIYIPELNQIATAEVGQNMFEKIYVRAVTKIVNFKGREYKFAKLDDAECAMHNGSESLLDYNCDGYFTHKRGSFIDRGKENNKLPEPIKYKVTNRYLTASNSFKYEVVYQGKVGSKIKVAYNEFYSDLKTGKFMIRPAFEQIIEYELEEQGNTIIGFKGLRIDVVKATNLDITYKIVRDYD